jgi:Cysteine-rich secretory protein family
MAPYASLSDAADRDQAVNAKSRYSVRLLASINPYRVTHGVVELNPVANLDVLAYEHSKYMAQAGHLSHEGYRERGMRSGSPVCVENVGWNYASPEAQLQAWIESPGHNKDPKVTKAGVVRGRLRHLYRMPVASSFYAAPLLSAVSARVTCITPTSRRCRMGNPPRWKTASMPLF